MPDTAKRPTWPKIQLGRELRIARKNARLTLEEAAAALGWSTAGLSRVENAQAPISEIEVATFLGLYTVAPTARRRILNVARNTDRRGWWSGAPLPTARAAPNAWRSARRRAPGAPLPTARAAQNASKSGPVRRSGCGTARTAPPARSPSLPRPGMYSSPA